MQPTVPPHPYSAQQIEKWLRDKLGYVEFEADEALRTLGIDRASLFDEEVR